MILCKDVPEKEQALTGLGCSAMAGRAQMLSTLLCTSLSLRISCAHTTASI